MIRQIIRPNKKQVILDIPSEFVGHQVEIIAFQIDDKTIAETTKLKQGKNLTSKERFSHLMKFIQTHPIKLPPKYKFNREDLYE